MISTCKDCEERSATCHGSCERYLAARQGHIEESREISRQKISDKLYRDYVIDSRAKIDSRVRSQHRRKAARKHEV